MNYITGEPKQIDEFSLNDALKYPIWIITFNEHGIEDQEIYQRPVVSTDDVIPEMVNPMITLKIKDTGNWVTAEYYIPSQILSKIWVWVDQDWINVDDVPGLKLPIIFTSQAKIDGIENIEFLLTSFNDNAKRI